MSIVLAGACLGCTLLGVGIASENPILKRLSVIYLIVVAVLFCVWRALATAAEEEGES